MNANQGNFQMAIVRHGQSQGNVKNVWHGARTDAELTDVGRQQAQLTGAYLAEAMPGVKTVYSSPLKRAKVTADIIAAALGAEVELLPDLIEIDWGKLEGLTTAQVAEQFPEVIRLWGTHLSTPLPGGDAAADVAKRVAAALQSIAEEHNYDGRVVVVSHQGAITLGLGALLQDENGMLDHQASNCGIMMVEFGPSPVLRVSDYNDHLTAGGIETGKWAF